MPPQPASDRMVLAVHVDIYNNGRKRKQLATPRERPTHQARMVEADLAASLVVEASSHPDT